MLNIHPPWRAYSGHHFNRKKERIMKLILKLMVLMSLSTYVYAYQNTGFICNGRLLLTAGETSSYYATPEDCQNAVNQSQNGFVCNGRLLLAAGQTKSYFATAGECQQAINQSQNGFVCNGRLMLAAGKTKSYFATPDDCHRAVSLSK